MELTATQQKAFDAWTNVHARIEVIERGLAAARGTRGRTIVEMRKAKLSWAQIEDLTGLSRQRLNQIVGEAGDLAVYLADGELLGYAVCSGGVNQRDNKGKPGKRYAVIGIRNRSFASEVEAAKAFYVEPIDSDGERYRMKIRRAWEAGDGTPMFDIDEF